MHFPIRLQHNSSQTWKEQFSISYEKNKKPRIDKRILNNKRTSGRITIPNFKLYYRAIVITVYGIGTHKDRFINGIESKTHK